MKKSICLLLFTVIVIANIHAFAAVNYTLPEKMEKQLSIGSGLKGSLKIHGEGTDPLIVSLGFLQDIELQFRGLKSGEDFLGYIYQEGENESQKGLTELYQKQGVFYLRSDLLPDEVISFPDVDELADHLHSPREGNPSLASSLMRLLRMSSQERTAITEPVINKLLQELEIWASNFVHTSESGPNGAGVSTVNLNYSIPMKDLKTEIVHLITVLTQDDDGEVLLQKLLTAEQQEVYANQFLDYYYLDALDSLNNDFDIQYTKTVSTLGQPVSSTLELPLDEARTGFETLILEEKGGLISCVLRNDERMFALFFPKIEDFSEIDSFSAWLISHITGIDEQDTSLHAFRLDITHIQSESTDEESREHLRETWEIHAVRDISRLPDGEKAEDYPEEEPISLKADLHYYSRYSQSSPTNLDAEITLSRGEQLLTISAQMKTASPWVLSGFQTEDAKSWLSLSQEERNLKLAELMSAAMETIVPLSSDSADSVSEEPEGSEPLAEYSDSESGDDAGFEETKQMFDEDTDGSPDINKTEEFPGPAEMTETDESYEAAPAADSEEITVSSETP